MKPLCRRTFLQYSALASAAYLAAACKMPITAVPGSLPTTVQEPLPVDTGSLDAETVDRIGRVVEATMKESRAPGLAVGVIQAGKVVFAKGFGVAKAGEERPVTPQTLFRVMDLTRPVVTAMAAFQLAEQGKLDLDAPIVEVLPYFKLQDECYRQVTTHHLLAEAAGLPLTREDNPSLDWIDKTPQTDPEALERYVRSLDDVTLYWDPGVHYRFSNMSYDVAGDVIAKASGELFEEYVEHHILAPLGMIHSTLFPLDADPALMASPHIFNRKEVIVSDLITYSRERTPSVGLLTSLEDMNRWALSALNQGDLNGTRIVQSSTYDQLWTPMFDAHYATDIEYLGLGWFLGMNQGHPVRQAWGNGVGFHACIYLAPEQRSGVVVMGNLFTDSVQTTNYASTMAGMIVPMVAW